VVVRQWDRGTPALAHRLLAAPAMNASDDLYVTHLGHSGPRVVFLHGLFGQGKNWTSVAKALQTEARVTLLDLPNHGRSAWTEDFSYVQMAEQVADRLAAESAGEPYAVVGHSMGGKVAMMVALHHRDLVARLCVVDVSPVPTAGMSNFSSYIEGMRSIDLATLDSRTAADAALQPYAPESTIRSFLLQNLRREVGVQPGWRWQMNLQLLGDRLTEIMSWPEVEAEPYAGPVLWLAGAKSRYVQPEYADAMRALFPRVRLVTVKDAGHWLHSDQPAVFTAAIRQFLHPHRSHF
jgi:esterase